MTALLGGEGEGGSKEARRCFVATIMPSRILLKDIESDSQCSCPSERRLSSGLLRGDRVSPQKEWSSAFPRAPSPFIAFLGGFHKQMLNHRSGETQKDGKARFFVFYGCFRKGRKESQFQKFRDPRPLSLTGYDGDRNTYSTLPPPLLPLANHRGYVRKTNSERKEFRCSRGCVVPQ